MKYKSIFGYGHMLCSGIDGVYIRDDKLINYSAREAQTRQAKFCWIVSSIIINTIDYTREKETRATQNAL